MKRHYRAGLALLSAIMVATLLMPGVLAAREARSEIVELAVLRAHAENTVKRLAHHGIMTSALEEQNTSSALLTEEMIQRREGDWRREIYSDNRPMIARLDAIPASRYLAEIKALSGGMYTELFALDTRGLVAAQSNVTPVYRHSEWPRWRETFPVGFHAVYIGPEEINRVTGVRQRQVAIPVANPLTGVPIGVICVGIDLDLI